MLLMHRRDVPEPHQSVPAGHAKKRQHVHLIHPRKPVSESQVMKKLVRSFVLAGALVVLAAVPALAAEGGAPAAHGVSGRDFGAAVSGLVTSMGGQALAAHVGK